MPKITGFRAIHYPSGTDLSLVTAPPYDVISPVERDRLELSHPHNIVKITLGSDRAGDAASSNRYSRAAHLLRKWLASGQLVKDREEHVYLYRSDFSSQDGPGATAGVVAALELDELGDAQVYGHEMTTPGPKADRLALMRASRANLEPLWFFASETIGGFAHLVQKMAGEPAVADLVDTQGTRHRVWVLPDRQAEETMASLLSMPVVVADGHHRYETCLTYRDERREQDGPGPWDYTLALISDPQVFQPECLPIHRLVKDLSLSVVPGARPFKGSLEDLHRHVRKAGPGTIGMASMRGRWTIASSGEVDTVWLSENVLEPSGQLVTYEHDPDLVARAVAQEGATAFIMPATAVPLVARKALAGVRMPPKTTLFWPKPRSGLLMRDLEPG